jgi:flagellar biosynthesis/type III secretory pathway chaperone
MNPMDSDLNSIDWEQELASLLVDLSTAQDELIEVLTLKRQRMASSDRAAMESLAPRENELAARLQQCHQRRAKLLDLAQQAGRPSKNIRQLAASLPSETRGKLGKQVKTVSSRLRMLQHHSLSNWVLAQRTVLHLSQLLEIVATGGRIQPTYGKGESAHSRGALVDREA